NLGDVAAHRGEDERAHALYTECLTLYREVGYRQGVVETLEAFAALYAARGRRAQAARLWGFAEAQREVLGVPLPPVERVERSQALTALRAAMGEEAFAAAWAAGRALTLEQALEESEIVKW